MEIKDGETLNSEDAVRYRTDFEIPRKVRAALDGLTGYRDCSRSDLVKDFVLWALESIDEQTGDFPDVHPRTGRSRQEVLTNPRSGKILKKQPQ